MVSTSGVRPIIANDRMLRVCVICEAFSAGVGRFVTTTTAKLAALGHEVTVIYSPLRLDQANLDLLERTPRVRLHPLPMQRSISLSDFHTVREIARIIRENGPFDVIHGHSAKGGGYARLQALFTHTPVIYSPHAFITLSPLVSGLKWSVYAMLERLLAPLTARIICCSGSEAQHARRLGISNRRLTVVPNGMSIEESPDRTALLAEHGLDPADIIVGFVGRMEEQKAPERLIEAAVVLFPQVPNLKFVMIGDGPKRYALEELLRSIPGGERVIWLGNIEARRIMGMFDIFALTSLYEGFPFVLVEALWAGLPIVSTPVGGTEEMIELGINGFLVPHDSTRRLSEAIRALALDPDLRRRMGAASQVKASEFTIANCCDQIELVYRDAIARRNRVKRNDKRD